MEPLNLEDMDTIKKEIIDEPDVSILDSDSSDSGDDVINLGQCYGKPEYSRFRVLSISSLSSISTDDGEYYDQPPSDTENKIESRGRRKNKFELPLPKIKKLSISVKEEEAKQLGQVEGIVNDVVMISAFTDQPPLDLNTVLFLDKGKTTLGLIFDVYGQIDEPYYLVRFNTNAHIKKKGIEKGNPVFYAPTTQHTNFVILDELKRLKGSDASWIDDREVPEHALDYSDDEEERLAKNKGSKSTKVQKNISEVRENRARCSARKLDSCVQNNKNAYRTSIDRSTIGYQYRGMIPIQHSSNYFPVKQEWPNQASFPSSGFGEPALFRSLRQSNVDYSSFGNQNTFITHETFSNSQSNQSTQNWFNERVCDITSDLSTTSKRKILLPTPKKEFQQPEINCMDMPSLMNVGPEAPLNPNSRHEQSLQSNSNYGPPFQGDNNYGTQSQRDRDNYESSWNLNMQNNSPSFNNMMLPPTHFSNMQGASTTLDNMQRPPPILGNVQGPPPPLGNIKRPPPLIGHMQGTQPASRCMQGLLPTSDNMQCPSPLLPNFQTPPPSVSNMQGPPPASNYMQGPPLASNYMQGPPPASNYMQGPPPASTFMQGPPPTSVNNFHTPPPFFYKFS